LQFTGGRAALQANLGGLAAALLDLGLDDVPGLDVLRHWWASDPELPVIVITARSGLDSVVEAMRTGAYDYLSKPLERERLLVSLHHAIERMTLVRRVWCLSHGASPTGTTLVGRSPAMRQLREHIQRVLQSDVAVCILGESGTGKELVARAIHQEGHRRKGPFVAVNCGAIPENLIEVCLELAELFLEHVTERCSLLEQAVAVQDRDAIARNAHSIASSASGVQQFSCSLQPGPLA
jgi:DNA-binding NtrC family response regulator